MDKDLQDLKTFADIRAVGMDDRYFVYRKAGYYAFDTAPNTLDKLRMLVYVGGQSLN